MTDPELENTENGREKRWTAISIAESLLRTGVIVDLDAEEEPGRATSSHLLNVCVIESAVNHFLQTHLLWNHHCLWGSMVKDLRVKGKVILELMSQLSKHVCLSSYIVMP